MIGNIDDLRSDPSASVDGLPLDLESGRVLFIRRAGGHNRGWAMGLAEVADSIPGLDALEEGERAARLNAEVAACKLVARWEGFEDDKGKPIEYSRELGVELFEAAPDVLDEVLGLAMNKSAYALARDKKK